MKHKITPNSRLRYIWEDKYENFSQEKKRQLKSYFQKLHNTPHVKIETVATNKPGLVLTSIGNEEIENVQESSVQLKLLLKHLTDNASDIDQTSIERLNAKVDGRLEANEASEFNKWEIDKITMDNFLSYGNLTIINYNDIKGLTLIPSDNQMGKTTAFIEILLFVLYGVTTKTNKVEDIFNIYTDKNYVLGEIHAKFDNRPHIIERKIVKTPTRDKTSFNYKSTLTFKEVDQNGQFIDLGGEQKDTKKDIKKLIGSAEDFLMTVLCTGDNLTDLISSLPTERGKVLTKFLGLEVFSKKEKIAKELEKEWKEKSSLVKYSLGDLLTEQEERKSKIETNEVVINEKKTIEASYDAQLKLLSDNKELLLSSVKNDIKDEGYDIKSLEANLEAYESQKINKDEDLRIINERINNYGEIVFNPEEYNVALENKSKFDLKVNVLINEIKSIDALIVNLKNGEKCSECGQSLKDVDHTHAIDENINKRAEKVSMGKVYRSQLDESITIVNNLKEKSEQFQVKERDLLMKDKIEIDIENLSLRISNEKQKIVSYNENLEKIEENKKIKDKIRLVEIDIDQLNIRKKDLIKELQLIESESRMCEIRNSEIDNIILTINKDQVIAKVFSVYIEAMGKNGISKTILKTIIPQINYELEKMMEDVCNFTTTLEINVDTNEVEFWMHDNETPIKKLLKTGSGYEKTVAALALRVVLNRVNTLPKLNVLVLDEILGKVGQNNLETIKTFLDKVKKHFDNVILITHNTMISGWGDNIIEVTKENNSSKLYMK